MKEEINQPASVDQQENENLPTNSDVKRWMYGSASQSQEIPSSKNKNKNIALKAFRASVEQDKGAFDERADELAKGMMSSVLK
ncbi:MAG: hypothetical protein ACI4AH_04825 [Muribaculaceae bacterium]